MADLPYGLGKLPSVDSRNRLHLMAREVPTKKPTVSKTWNMRERTLNQGNTGTCVGHAGKHWMMCVPLQSKLEHRPSAVDLYTEACLGDEYPDNDNLRSDDFLDFGTSILGLMRTLKKRNLIRGSYLWAYNGIHVAGWVAQYGPVIIGVDWHYDMFQPDGGNAIHPRGPVAGGHALLVVGYHAPTDQFILLNSWGPNWGHDGRVLINFSELDYLILKGGEAAAATEKRA